MSLVALLTWIATASLGLYLLSVWLIEYDKDFQADADDQAAAAGARRPRPLGGGGLIVWAYYLFFDNDDLAWISVGTVLVGASLGVFMANRWLEVYRAKRQVLRAGTDHATSCAAAGGRARPVGARGRARPAGAELPAAGRHRARRRSRPPRSRWCVLTAFGVGGS